ncbi:MAG: ribonuclease J [candidate division NC10 bacterium]|nr:ribonuclease J [candidate division NC10 bacterium]
MDTGMGRSESISIVPLGGLGEIGMNMMALRSGEDLLVIDAGLMFPEEEMLGVDLVIPDISFLLEHREKIRGILLTHGHEDHTGALPFLLREIRVPIYGTALTLGLVSEKLREAGLLEEADLRRIRPRDRIRLGGLGVEFIRVCHSIADGVGLAIHTPAGLIVHTGDFKLDQSPVDGEFTDLHRFADLGAQGVLVLLSDSTNADQEGNTPSERSVGEALEEIFRRAKRRIILACFASNIHRIQQVFQVAARLGRKVAVHGKTMVANVRIASELGYLNIPNGTMVRLEEMRNLPPERILILTTGSQGEPLSAISRMAMGEHKQIQVQPGDTVIISAKVIPGNEKSIAHTINHLFKRGAEVIYDEIASVHASGHPAREELRLMLHLTRPRFFIPIHGEYRHLHFHANLAEEMGVPRDHIFLPENGDILEFGPDFGRIAGKVPAGRVLVDGKGIGDVGETVLRDRQHLSQDGMVIVVLGFDRQSGEIVSGPEIVSRGFVYQKESEELFEAAKKLVRTVLEGCSREEKTEMEFIKPRIRNVLRKFLYREIRRRPMIIPVIMEV